MALQVRAAAGRLVEDVQGGRMVGGPWIGWRHGQGLPRAAAGVRALEAGDGDATPAVRCGMLAGRPGAAGAALRGLAKWIGPLWSPWFSAARQGRLEISFMDVGSCRV